MAVTGYLGLPAEMANIHLRPPTRSSRARARARARTAAPARAHCTPCPTYVSPCCPLDTHSLRLIIVIYAPATNVTSLIRPSWIADPTRVACKRWKKDGERFTTTALLPEEVSEELVPLLDARCRKESYLRATREVFSGTGIYFHPVMREGG